MNTQMQWKFLVEQLAKTHGWCQNGYSEKTPEKLRDEVWKNLRCASIKKRDAQRSEKRTSGGLGGADCKITEVDQLVFAIIGKDSAVLDGMDVTENHCAVRRRPFCYDSRGGWRAILCGFWR